MIMNYYYNSQRTWMTSSADDSVYTVQPSHHNLYKTPPSPLLHAQDFYVTFPPLCFMCSFPVASLNHLRPRADLFVRPIYLLFSMGVVQTYREIWE